MMMEVNIAVGAMVLSRLAEDDKIDESKMYSSNMYTRTGYTCIIYSHIPMMCVKERNETLVKGGNSR